MDNVNDKHSPADIVEAMFGPDEDFLEEGVADEFLLASGIDPTTLLQDFKAHLENRARQLQAKKGTVPDSISWGLRALRERIKSSDPMNVNPSDHIGSLLAGTLGSAASAGATARAYRRDTDEELSDKDKNLLDELEAELNEDDETSAQ